MVSHARPRDGPPAAGIHYSCWSMQPRGCSRSRCRELRMDRIRTVIMGAAGRDFHDFQVLYRDDPTVEVVAFTATQIPGIDSRTYPAVIAGLLYPDGIPIVPESELAALIREKEIAKVVFAYSDVAHVDVMHKAS